MKKVALAAMLCGALCTPVLAQGPVDTRQENQKARIKQGVKSGELTKKEARQLVNEQKKVRAAERKAKADGDVTRKEARKLDRKQDKASQKILRQKQDKQNRK